MNCWVDDDYADDYNDHDGDDASKDVNDIDGPNLNLIDVGITSAPAPDIDIREQLKKLIIVLE